MAKFSKKGTAHARKRRVDKTYVKFKDLPAKEQRKQIMIAAAAVIVLIAIIVIYRTELFSYLGGRIRFTDGALKGVQANDFVINRESSKYGEDGRYYVIGSLDMPEGFKENPDFISNNDKYEQNFSYVVEEKEGYSEMLVFMGCTKDWEELISNVTGKSASETSTVEYSDRYDLVSAEKGNAYHGAMQTQTERSEENGYYLKYAYAYVETGAKDSCVMIQLTYKAAYKKDIPTDAEAMKDLEKYVDMINPVK